MTFDLFRRKSVDEGKTIEKCDEWDVLYIPRKVEKPKFVRVDGKVYQDVFGKLVPLHGEKRFERTW